METTTSDPIVEELIPRDGGTTGRVPFRRIRDATSVLFASRVAVVGLTIVLFWVFVAIFAPLLTPYTPLEQDWKAPNQGPSAAHPLGTDELGRDLWSRLIYGARVVLVILPISERYWLPGGTALWGVFVALLFGTTLGLAYHHGFDLEIPTATFNGLPGQASASLPGWVQAGVTQEIGEDARVMLEGRWINWSVFDAIDISTPALSGTPYGTLSDRQEYDDAFFFALGGEYDLAPGFTLRGGIAWDQTPTTDAFRTPRVPDEDRLWLSVGASYAITDRISLDASYSYLHALNDPEVTLRNGPLAGTRVDYKGGAHIVSVGGSIRF